MGRRKGSRKNRQSVIPKFICSRCDKEKLETDCICWDCFQDMKIWYARLIFNELDSGIGFQHYNKIKRKFTVKKND